MRAGAQTLYRLKNILEVESQVHQDAWASEVRLARALSRSIPGRVDPLGVDPLVKPKKEEL